MSLKRKIELYFHTVRYLKWIQVFYRLAYKVCRPVPDLTPAPEKDSWQPQIPFPAMVQSLFPPDVFCFLNEQHAFTNWNDPERNKLYLYNLHYFDWLRQAELPEEEGRRWIDQWIAENPPPTGNGWEPYTLSLRIVNWIKWDLSGHALSLLQRQSLVEQVRFLMQILEYHLLGNHLMANAKALVFAGMYFAGEEGERFLQKGVEIYNEQLPEQIFPDGGHFELSPMYHSIILEDLLDLKNISAPLDLDDRICRMVRWLMVMTAPDGEIARFNDAASGVALPPERLFKYAQQLNYQVDKPDFSAGYLLPQSGYVRLERGPWTLIADCGEVGPSYQPGHAHADALSFELWKDSFRVILDSGTLRYYVSPERMYQRSSRAHNTIVIDNQDSSEIWSAHRVGRRGHAQALELLPEICGAMGVYRTWKQHYISRKWELQSDGTCVITDQIDGRGKHLVEQFFHFAPECQCCAMDQPGEFLLSLPEQCSIKICLDGQLQATQRSVKGISRQFGVLETSGQLSGTGEFVLPVTLKTTITMC